MRTFSDQIIDPGSLKSEIKKMKRFTIKACVLTFVLQSATAYGVWFLIASGYQIPKLF